MHAGIEGPLTPLRQEIGHGCGDVVVVRGGVGHARSKANVRGDNGCTGRGRDRKILVISEAADVVTDAGALGESRPGDRRPPCVNTYGDVESTHEFRDDQYDALEFLGLVDLFTRSGPHATNIQEVRPLVDESLGALEKRIEVERGGRFVKGVAGAIEDAHDERARREVERGCTE